MPRRPVTGTKNVLNDDRRIRCGPTTRELELNPPLLQIGSDALRSSVFVEARHRKRIPPQQRQDSQDVAACASSPRVRGFAPVCTHHEIKREQTSAEYRRAKCRGFVHAADFQVLFSGGRG